jgi:hypothetical protein
LRLVFGIAFALGWALATISLAASGSQNRVSHAPTDAEARELLRAICPNGIRPYRLGAVTRQACIPCPSFTSWGASARLRRTSSFGLQTVIYGSFSAHGTQEAVLDFYGCEDHTTTANFQASVFFRKVSGQWHMVDYIRTETSACQLDPLPSGRDILVCKGFTGHADQAEEWIFALEFPTAGGWRKIGLFGVINTWGACGPTAIIGSIPEFQLLDLNYDGALDVRITAKVASEAPGGKLGVCEGNFTPPPAKAYRIDFLYKQGTFVVAPWSVKTKEMLEQTFEAARQKVFGPH